MLGMPNGKMPERFTRAPRQRPMLAIIQPMDGEPRVPQVAVTSACRESVSRSFACYWPSPPLPGLPAQQGGGVQAGRLVSALAIDPGKNVVQHPVENCQVDAFDHAHIV